MTTTTRGQDTAALLERITRRIVEPVDPERIILFGSRAKGTAEDASDIDLCVIVDMEESRRIMHRKVRALLTDFRIAMDVYVIRPSEFDRQKKLINSISYFIDRDGKILYERTDGVGSEVI